MWNNILIDVKRPSMLNALLFLAILVPHALTQTIHREPHGVSYNAGSEMHIRVRESENRDPLFCEPYEEMYIDEDDCNIYCMLNGEFEKDALTA